MMEMPQVYISLADFEGGPEYPTAFDSLISLDLQL